MYRSSTPKKSLHFVEVKDGLMFTVDSDQSVVHVEVWAPAMNDWITVTHLVSAETKSKYAQKIADKIAFDKEAV